MKRFLAILLTVLLVIVNAPAIAASKTVTTVFTGRLTTMENAHRLSIPSRSKITLTAERTSDIPPPNPNVYYSDEYDYKCNLTIEPEYDDDYFDGIDEDEDSERYDVYEEWSRDLANPASISITLPAGVYMVLIESSSYWGTDFNYRITASAEPVEATSITLNKKKSTLRLGRELQLIARLKPKADSVVKWSSSNTKVASVSKQGIVKAKKQGKATITAKLPNGKKAKCVITVPKPTLDDNIYAKSPVWAEAIEVTNGGMYSRAYVDLYNLSKKKVTYVELDIFQYDNRGKRLKSPVSGFYILNDSLESGYHTVDTYWSVNAKTKKIRTCVVKAWYSGGKTWKNPYHKEWVRKYSKKY